MRIGRTFGAALGFLLLAAGAARADAIDGDWCTQDGRLHMSIQGPRIVTPGGRALEGNYSRHGFSYQAPEREPDAGHTVNLLLVNEQTVYSAVDEQPRRDAPAKVWRRCQRPVS